MDARMPAFALLVTFLAAAGATTCSIAPTQTLTGKYFKYASQADMPAACQPTAAVGTPLDSTCCTSPGTQSSTVPFSNYLSNASYFTQAGGFGVSSNPQCPSPGHRGFHALMQCNNNVMTYKENCGPIAAATGAGSWNTSTDCSNCQNVVVNKVTLSAKPVQAGVCYKASGNVTVWLTGCATADNATYAGGSCSAAGAPAPPTPPTPCCTPQSTKTLNATYISYESAAQLPAACSNASLTKAGSTLPDSCCASPTSNATVTPFSTYLNNSKYFSQAGGYGVSSNPQCPSPGYSGFHAHMQCSSSGQITYQENCGPCPATTTGPGCTFNSTAQWYTPSSCSSCSSTILSAGTVPAGKAGMCMRANGYTFVWFVGCVNSAPSGGGSCSTASTCATPPPPTPTPTPAKTVTKTPHTVKSTVTLAGISVAQFDTKARNGFKSAVAKLAGKHCGTASALIQCDLNNVELDAITTVTARRDLSVTYTIYVASAAAATAATATLAAVSPADFKAAVNAGFTAYGSSVQTTGVTVTSAPKAATSSSSSSSSGLGGGAIAGIVIACVVCVVIIGGVAFFAAKKKTDGHQDGTNMHGTAIRGPDADPYKPPTMGNDAPTAGQI